MKTNKVVILRHGESEFNKLNLFCGWHDAPLSERGLQDSQKIAAANLLKHKMQFDCAYTSVLQRAHQTLNVICRELNCVGLPTTCDWRLNERHYGNLTGFNKRDLANKYGEEQVQKWRRSYDVFPPAITPDNPYYDCIRDNPAFCSVPSDQFPYTESMKATYQRVIPVWNEILTKVFEGQRVLVVVHGTVARALVKHIEDISDEDINLFNIPNSVPCLYEFNQNTGKLIGKVEYLADEEYVKKQTAKVAAIGK